MRTANTTSTFISCGSASQWLIIIATLLAPFASFAGETEGQSWTAKTSRLPSALNVVAKTPHLPFKKKFSTAAVIIGAAFKKQGTLSVDRAQSTVVSTSESPFTRLLSRILSIGVVRPSTVSIRVDIGPKEALLTTEMIGEKGTSSLPPPLQFKACWKESFCRQGSAIIHDAEVTNSTNGHDTAPPYIKQERIPVRRMDLSFLRGLIKNK